MSLLYSSVRITWEKWTCKIQFISYIVYCETLVIKTAWHGSGMHHQVSGPRTVSWRDMNKVCLFQHTKCAKEMSPPKLSPANQWAYRFSYGSVGEELLAVVALKLLYYQKVQPTWMMTSPYCIDRVSATLYWSPENMGSCEEGAQEWVVRVSREEESHDLLPDILFRKEHLHKTQTCWGFPVGSLRGPD